MQSTCQSSFVDEVWLDATGHVRNRCISETALTADHDPSTDMMPIERHASKSKKWKGKIANQ
jgi:hypothetical protein